MDVPFASSRIPIWKLISIILNPRKNNYIIEKISLDDLLYL